MIMNKLFLLFITFSCAVVGQNLKQNIDNSIQNLLHSEGGKSAQIAMTIANSEGKIIYNYQGNIGLTTASTQKIFTAAAALETLGKNYTYTTTASYSGDIKKEVLKGNIYIQSNGDPTLGSWRYDGFTPEIFKEKFYTALQKAGIKQIQGDIILDDSYFDFQTIPGGWAWDDLGNYYGAGVWGINWRENQFDLKIKGNSIHGTNIKLPNVQWVSEVTPAGNSDKSLIFTAPHSNIALINGELPADRIMTISGAMPNPPLTLGEEIKIGLLEKNILFTGNILVTSSEKTKGNTIIPPRNLEKLMEYSSPTLEKIIYWFLRKSVNLYGETLIKTMSKEKKGDSKFKTGIQYLKSFWATKGIPSSMINFADGSGLSPQNYVSSQAEVQALIWAKKQTWFSSFYDGFPTINGMKMKSGTMRNTKSFAGYHNGYTFSVILNNYQGDNSSESLFKVLNYLK